MIELGSKVRDKVSGFEGLALARQESLYEATQYRIHPITLNRDGEIITSVWIEEGRLDLLEIKPLVAGFMIVKGKEHG